MIEIVCSHHFISQTQVKQLECIFHLSALKHKKVLNYELLLFCPSYSETLRLNSFNTAISLLYFF